jgi:hypothetical protein
MDVSHLHSAIDIENIAIWLGIKSTSGKQAFRSKCTKWHDSLPILQSLSYQFASIRHIQNGYPEVADTISSILSEFTDIEPEIRTILEPASAMEQESSAELMFLGNILSPLNFIPYFLSLWTVVRVYILPGMAILMPILMSILPYIILRFVFHLHIPMDRYIVMMLGLLTGDTGSLFNPSQTPSFGEMIRAFFMQVRNQPVQALVKVGGVGATVVQSVIQPYFTYRHLAKINTIISNQATQLTQLRSLYERLRSVTKQVQMEMCKCPIPEYDTERQYVASALLDSAPYTLTLHLIGQLEAIWQLAKNTDVCPVRWIESSEDQPIFILNNTFDIRITDRKHCKPISLHLSGKQQSQHALLTGPNRGGKSTALRAMTTCALLAHTYGCSIGSNAEMTPYRYMFAGLKADDIPGQKSHFEREVEFTAHTLRMDGPTLVFVDELFHTTNPPDALESCRIYCEKLWKSPNMVSVISTHLFDLVEMAETSVQRICCPAKEDQETGQIVYAYGLEEGVCKVSSVSEILRKYGLL